VSADFQDPAVAMLLSESGEQRLGTAFAVSGDEALTAWHCVGDRTSGRVEHPVVRLRFVSGHSLVADVRQGDAPADFACLALRESLPPRFAVLRLRPRAESDESCRLFGFPIAETGVKMTAASGKVVSPRVLLNDGTPVVSVLVDQAAAGLSLHGFSGGPVGVGPDHLEVVGIVRRNQPRGDDPSLALGAMVYACPMRPVLEHLPHLTRPSDASAAVNELQSYREALARAAHRVSDAAPPLQSRTLIYAKGATNADSSHANLRDIVEHEDHLVIEGEPGLGKSTLLEELAATYAGSPLLSPPILVRARDLAAAPGSWSERLMRASRARLDVHLDEPLAPDLFNRAPSGHTRWLVLVDALDEIPEAAERQQLVDALEARTKSDSDETRRYVLTARVGTPLGRLPDTMTRLLLTPLNDSQIREFAATRLPGHQRDAFLASLARGALGTVAGTPLILTLAAEVFESRGAIPLGRAAVYRAFVDRMLARDAWRAVADAFVQRWGDALRLDASQLLSTNPQIFLEGLARERGTTLLAEAVGIIVDNSSTELEEDLSHVLVRTGLATRRDGDLEWIHATFHSYFAAGSAIAQLPDPGSRKARRFVDRLVRDREDEQVLFMLERWTSTGKSVDALVNRIRVHGVRRRGSDEHRLLLALRSLALRVPIAAEQRDRIVDDALSIASKQRSISMVPAGVLAGLVDLGPDERIEQGLLHLISDPAVHPSMRLTIAVTARKLGHALTCERAIVELAAADLDDLGRLCAALALREINRAQDATRILVELTMDRSADFRYLALKALAAPNPPPEALEAAMEIAAAGEEDSSLRNEAIRLIGFAKGSAEAAGALVDLALQPDALVSWEAAKALRRIGAAQDLATIARDARCHVLGAWDAVDELQSRNALTELRAVIDEPRLPKVVTPRAVNALARCDGGPAELLAALSVNQVSRTTRTWLVITLDKAGDGQTAIDICCDLVRGAADSADATDVIESLADLNAVDGLARLAIDERLDFDLRLRAVFGIVRVPTESGRAAVRRLLTVSDPYLRTSALSCLAILGFAEEATARAEAIARDAEEPLELRLATLTVLELHSGELGLRRVAADTAIEPVVRKRASDLLERLSPTG
jgi:Trypsin-like peptidase domain